MVFTTSQGASSFWLLRFRCSVASRIRAGEGAGVTLPKCSVTVPGGKVQGTEWDLPGRNVPEVRSGDGAQRPYLYRIGLPIQFTVSPKA